MAQGKRQARTRTLEARKVRAQSRRVASHTDARLRSVFRAAPVGVGLVADRVLLEVNDRLCDMTGYTPDDLIGRNARILYATDEDYEYVGREKYAQIRRRGTGTVETRWRRRDGHVIDVLLSSTPVKMGDLSHGVTFTALDITAWKQSQARLEASEERYRQIFEHAVLGIYRTTPDGTIRAANPALVRMLGYDSLESLAQRNLEEEGYQPDYSRSAFKQRIEADGEVIGLESAWTKRDGTALFVRENARAVRDRSGRTLFYEGTVEDITAQKRTEEELRNVFNLSLDLVCIADIRSATFTKVNPAFTRVLGYQAHELVGRPFAEFIHPDDVGATDTVVREKLLRGETVINFENRYRCKDGSYRWLNWTSHPQMEQGLTYAVARDVTQRKEAADALAASERDKSVILESTAERVAFYDTDRRVQWVNRAAADSADASPGELIGRRCRDMWHHNEVSCQSCPLHLALQTGQPQEAEITTADGRIWNLRTYPVLDETGEVTGVTEFGQDITEQRWAERALRDREERYRTLFETANDAIAIMRNGLFADCNRKALEMFRCGRERMIGQTPFAFSPPRQPDGRDSKDVGLERVRAASAGTPQSFEWLHQRADGSTFDAQVSLNLVQLADGPYLQAIVRDITQLKDAERAARRSEARFRELAELLPQTVFEINVDGRVTFANRAGLETFGYHMEELRELEIAHFFDAADRGHLRQNFGRRLAGCPADTHEYHARRKDGSTFPVLVYSEPIVHDGKPAGLRGLVLDISERKQAQEQLAHERNLMRTLIDTLPDATYVKDRQSRFLLCSRAVLRTTGQETADALIGKTDFDFYPQEIAEALYREEQALMQSGQPVINRERCFADRQTGRPVWDLTSKVPLRDAEGNVVGLVGISTNITEIKQMQESLRQNQARLQSIFESSPQAITVTDLEGTIEDCNQASLKTYGLSSREEALGRSVFEFIASEEVDHVRRQMPDLLSSGSVLHVEHQLLRRDGRAFPGELSAGVIRDPAGQPMGLVAISADITERKQAEAALRDSEQKHRLFLENFDGIAYQISHETLRPLFFYGCAEEITGYTTEDFSSARITWHELIHRDDLEHVRELAAKLRDTFGYVADSEYRIRARNGQIRWVRDIARTIRTHEGRPRFFQGAIYDVTERRQAEQALRESENRFRELAENIREAFWVFDWQNQKVLYVSPAYEEIWAMPSQALLEDYQRWSQSIHPDDLQYASESFRRIVETGGGESREYRIVRPDGTVRWISDRGFAVHDDAGAVRRIVGIAEDITDRRWAEQALRDNERFLTDIFNGIQDGISVLDSELNVVRVNRWIETMYATQAPLVGKKCYQVYQHRQSPCTWCPSLKALQTGEPCSEIVPYPSSENPTGWIDLSAFPLRDATGHVAGVIEHVKDISERREAEQALEESERRFRAIFESAIDGILVADTQRLTFLMANERMCEMLGYSLDELLRLRVSDIHPSDRAADVLESFDRQARGEISLAEEVPIQRKNGEIFFADISASLITLGRAEYLIGIFRDITERRRVESERQEAQAFLETAIAQSPSGILIADAPDVTIRMANPIALTIRGAGPDHLTGIEVGHHAPNWQTFRPDGSPYPSEQLPLSRAVLNGEVTLGEEVIIRDESDQDHWVMANAAPIRDSEGHVTAGIVVFHDITERKRAERALRESEERLGQIVHGTSIATFVVDREHRITHWNKACEALTGLRAQDMCGTQDQWRAFYAHERPTMADLVLDGCPEDVVEKYYGTAYRPASVVKGAFEAEGHFAGLGENGKWLFFTAAPLMDHDGRVTGAIETLQDITDRKRAEQERLEYERKLRFLASELSLAEERERRRLAAGLHDEACQTLVLTNMKLQELRQSMGGPEDQPLAEICEKLTSAIQSVRDLTFDLSSPTLYKFGLEAALEELLHDKLKAEHGIRCRFGDDGAPKPLAEDVRILLYQSVRELLMNVIKHANADEVSLDTQRDGDSIRVTVTDDGVGFEVDALLASPSRNRGFGLFNIKERLDYIGGRVEIEAQPGQGSRFTLVAPLETTTPVAKERRDVSQDSAGR